MTTYLLDANVLIALLVPEHEHHDPARAWLVSCPDEAVFVLSPITEGAYCRYMLRCGYSIKTSQAALNHLHSLERWAFWPDDASYADIDMNDVHGHKQVTDTYLAELAHSHGGLLVTCDHPLAQRRQNTTMLIPGVIPGA